MSEMDWESKFSSIVRETESNLDKVKQRLGSARASSSAALTLNDHRVSPFGKGRPFSTSLNSMSMTGGAMPGLNQSLTGLIPTTSPASSTHFKHEFLNGKDPTASNGQYLPLENSPGIIMLMQDRMEAQGRVIDQLARSVRRLEEEKEIYLKQMKDTRDELALLNSRFVEKGVDVQTERKVEQWRREVMGEMQMIHTQLNLQRGRDSDSGISSSIVRDIIEVRKYSQDECDSLRRELDVFKGRLGRMESQLTSVTLENRESERRQGRLENEVRCVANSQVLEPSRSGELTVSGKELDLLKDSYQSMKAKLGDIENKLKTNSPITERKVSSPKSTRFGTKPYMPRATADLFSPNTSDFELSESTDLDDLKTCDLEFSTKAKERPILTPTGDEDILLTDLNLTTDDLSSIGDTLDLDDLH